MAARIDWVTVSLTYGELRVAAEVGVQRQALNMRDGRRHRHKLPPENRGWTEHIEGAAGEMAAAKYLCRFWSGAIGDFKADDVGPYQVRTGSKLHYDLRLHPDDKDHKKFILVTGHAPSFNLVGWYFARDGKKKEYWKEYVPGRPCFFVPQNVLHPMSTLHQLNLFAPEENAA